MNLPYNKIFFPIHLKRKFAFVSFLFFVFWTNAQVNGTVLDEDAQPLPGASILLLPDSIFTISDNEGVFSFNIKLEEQKKIIVNYIGYQQAIRVINPSDIDKKIKIYLTASTENLHEVEIHGEHDKQEATLKTEHIEKEYLEKNLSSNFAQTIEKIPGLDAINVGLGVAKPVIRGLYGNRIIVNQNGIKQEGHQWGTDHGLEIDPFDVEDVEIIKGPASLQYGSDGLGGVINVKTDKIIRTNSWEATFLSNYKTNNQHVSGSGNVELNVKDVFASLRFSIQDYGDFRVPTEQFSYNSFTLPINNNRLKNTAANEQSFAITTGVRRKWGISKLSISRYHLNTGIFSGAVGIPRAYALIDDNNTRDIDLPNQDIVHWKATFNQMIYFNDDHVYIDVGYQNNQRKEFSFPEFHNIPLSQIQNQEDNTLALGFNLSTYSLNFHYENNTEKEFKWIHGGQLQYQNNQSEGFGFLIPNFNTFRTGIFTLVEKPINNIILNGGVRLDYANNQSEASTQRIWDSNENLVDSLSVPSTRTPFFNFSAALGSQFKFWENKGELKINFGKSFRVPYPSETVSNGIHHGTFRHEKGNPDLKSEHGYQLDMGLEYSQRNFYVHVSTYFNYFQNYIYLGPTFPAQFSPLPESGQLFEYRQDNAIYTGGEIEWEWRFLNYLKWNQSFDYVQSYNPQTKLALPFTPQPALQNAMTFALENKKKIDYFSFGVHHTYRLAAQGNLRIDRSEVPTPAYHLVELQSSMRWKIKKQTIELQMRVDNLFNTAYLNHLSRYRFINVPEQGRNFIFTLKLHFNGKINTKT